jgi:hypothetical protein
MDRLIRDSDDPTEIGLGMPLRHSHNSFDQTVEG